MPNIPRQLVKWFTKEDLRERRTSLKVIFISFFWASYVIHITNLIIDFKHNHRFFPFTTYHVHAMKQSGFLWGQRPWQERTLCSVLLWYRRCLFYITCFLYTMCTCWMKINIFIMYIQHYYSIYFVTLIWIHVSLYKKKKKLSCFLL